MIKFKINGSRNITVNATGAQSIQTINFIPVPLPSPIINRIKHSKTPLQTYCEWVLSYTNNKKAINRWNNVMGTNYNTVTDHLNEFGIWLDMCKVNGYEVTTKVTE